MGGASVVVVVVSGRVAVVLVGSGRVVVAGAGASVMVVDSIVVGEVEGTAVPAAPSPQAARNTAAVENKATAVFKAGSPARIRWVRR